MSKRTMNPISSNLIGSVAHLQELGILKTCDSDGNSMFASDATSSDTKPSDQKVEIIRAIAEDLTTSRVNFTICDECAYFVQIAMLEIYADVLQMPLQKRNRSLLQKRYDDIARLFLFSAYLIKSPHEKLYTPYPVPKDEIEEPAYVHAADLLNSLAEMYDELSIKGAQSSALSKRQLISTIQKRSIKIRELSLILKSDPDAGASVTMKNDNLFLTNGVWTIRPGYVYPIPIYIKILTEKDRPARWHYNLSGETNWGMMYGSLPFHKDVLPEKLEEFGRI